MTRKDYVAIASVFNKEYKRLQSYQATPLYMESFWKTVFDLRRLLELDNERFDSYKFMEAIRKVN